MFTKLRFQNFKSWEDTGDMGMTNITGFFGTNSSGKTAILQFLLMLKQTVESSDRQRILYMGGDSQSYVDLGTSYDLIHQHILPGTISFSLIWKPPISKPKLGLFAYNMDWDLIEEINPFIPSMFYSQLYSYIEFESEININIDNIQIEKMMYQYNSDDSLGTLEKILKEPKRGDNYYLEVVSIESNQEFSNTLKFKESPIKNWIKSVKISMDLTSKNTINNSYQLSINTSNFEDEIKSLQISCQAPFNSYSFPKESKKNKESKENIYLYYNNLALSNLEQSFENLFQNLYYLGPVREYPSRTYRWSGEKPQDVGKRGEWTIAALLAAQKSDPEILKKIASWLRELNLIHSFDIQPIVAHRQEYEVKIRRTPNSSEVSLTDVGFGVSQILPVLVLCYYVPEGASIILEQPEIHLHPSAQMGLADILIEVSKTRKLQIILESHSEHLLRRLQRRIAEEKFSNEDVALYFCSTDQEGKSNLTPLEVDKFGNINNWPDNFFGDEMGDLFAMTEANMNRQYSS